MTHVFTSSRRHHIGIAVATALAGLVFSPAQVDAEDFIPLPDPPVVTIVSAPGEDSATAIQPKFPNSGDGSGEYTVQATVTTNATLAALEKVTMCWYKVDIGTADLCAAVDPDPASSFQMVWTEEDATAGGTAGFAVSGSNEYGNAGSEVETTSGLASYDSTKNAMSIYFTFKVSNAMLAGSDWSLRVEAVYDEALCGDGGCPASYTLADRTGSDSEIDQHVAYWGQITAEREPLGFGLVAEGQMSDVETASGFAFVANAESDYATSGTDFTYDPDGAGPGEADVIPLTQSTPGAKRAKLECRADEGQTNASTQFVALDSTGVSLDADIQPTGETENTSGTIECRLQYGTSASFALKQYSNTVTLALGQKDAGAEVEVAGAGTIQAAIDAANVGDTVTVPAGTFVENLTINKRIRLECANAGMSVGASPDDTRGSETIIQGEAVVSSAGVEIDGCMFLRPAVGQFLSPKLVRSSGVTGTVTVRNSVFDFTWAEIDPAVGTSCGAGTFGTAAWRIYDSKFLNTRYVTSGGTACTDPYSSRAVQADGAQRTVVSGNHFFNTHQAVFITGRAADNSEVTNNLFTPMNGTPTSTTSQGGVFLGTPHNVLIKGNTFQGNSAVYMDATVGATIENNDFNVNSTVWAATTTSGITVRNNAIRGAYPESFGAFAGTTFFNYTSNSIDARLNYWGSASGPGTRVAGTGAGLVKTSPWIASYSPGSNPDARYSTGFWPTNITQGR